MGCFCFTMNVPSSFDHHTPKVAKSYPPAIASLAGDNDWHLLANDQEVLCTKCLSAFYCSEITIKANDISVQRVG